MKKTAAILSLALAISSIVTLTSPANAAAPAITSIAGPNAASVGSVTGGYNVTILGEDFCNGATADVSSVAIGTQSLSSVVVTCDHVSTTQDKIVAAVPSRTLANRTIGRQPVVVLTSQGANTSPTFFGYIPEVDESYSTSALVELGELFSRSQRKPIVRSLTAPYTVTGTDSLTGLPYTYITNYDYLGGLDCADPNSGDAEKCGAYSHEADLGVNFHPGAISPVVVDNGLSTRFQVSSSAGAAQAPSGVDTSAASNVPFDQWLGGRTVTELYSDLDCEPSATPDRGDLNPDNYFDSGDGDGAKYSFCSGFGPDIYSEPFVAQSGQSLAFEWSAIGQSDDYAVYAYLVQVDPNTGAIPGTATAANHELVMYNSGSRNGYSDWQTSTVDVDTAGTYRFRFVNGSYDGTGGFALGSLFYLNSFFLAGQTNEISFGEFDDVVYDPANLPQSFAITASSTAGGQPTVVSLTPNVCGVTSNNTTPPSYSVSVSVSPATCILQASQGATGPYAPAASVITAFEIYATAAAPGSPTLLAVTGTSQTELRVDFSAGPSGGSPVTGYQYSVDGGAWVNAPAGASQGVFTIAGLNAQTTYNVQIRAVNSVGSGSSSNTVAGTTLAGAQSNTPRAPEPYNGPEIISVVPNLVSTKGGETVVVIGRRLGVGTELSIGGIKVKLEAATETGFRFVMPESAEGLKNMLYTYNGGDKLTYLSAVRAVAPVVYPETGNGTGSGSETETEPKPWSAIGVANMFAPGSSVVNSRVRAQVVAMLRQYGSIATKVECSGFTMGPTVLRVDAALSKARANAVCGLIKQLRPRLTVVRAAGKQETKLGGEVRRVEVLFTKG
jgi:hypothetical protein